MGSDIEETEERLKSFLTQLRTEFAIFDKIVYKNKNQHRRCPYFQYLLKVRSDLRLLQSANLVDLLKSSFGVIHGKRPCHKVSLLESLKKRRCDGRRNNFLERLQGVAHLLSQMVEPMLKAATKISVLLAQSFFMGFALTSLALLARLRVLTQQMLLDIVWVFNAVSSESQKEQAAKITEGVEVFRDYYPTNIEFIHLECVWRTDRYVLVESTGKTVDKNRDKEIGESIPLEESAIQYKSIEIVLWDCTSSKKDSAADVSEKGSLGIEEHNPGSLVDPMTETNDCNHVENDSGVKRSRSPDVLQEETSSQYLNPKKMKTELRKVAFVSVKKPAPSSPKR